MATKEIIDGSDAILITELDDAAEARIISVLTTVFNTQRYPQLRQMIVDEVIYFQRSNESKSAQAMSAMHAQAISAMQSKMMDASAIQSQIMQARDEYENPRNSVQQSPLGKTKLYW